jgi:hypothetical protein
MGKKVLNNKVNFFAGGKEVTIKLSDKELKTLKNYSVYHKNDNLYQLTMMQMHNFSIHAYCDYVLKGSSKAAKVKVAFPYHDYDNVWWELIEHKDVNEP